MSNEGRLPAGYEEEIAAEHLARITNVTIQLARLVIYAEEHNSNLNDDEIMRQRIENVNFLLRIIRAAFIIEEHIL